MFSGDTVRREEERGETQAVFLDTFKPILMRKLTLHVSLLHTKICRKTLQSSH